MKNRRIIMLLLVLALAFGMMAAGTVSVSAATKTPKQVTGVKVTLAKDTSISLSWSKATYAKKYEVQYKKSSDKKWKSKKTSSKKIAVSGLKADTKYNFKVRGINGSKKGKFSKTVTQTTYKTPGAVDMETIFPSERTKRTITLEWGEAKNASWYEIAVYRLDGTLAYPEQDPQETNWTFPQGYANTYYGFKVRTVNAKTGKFPALKSSWSKMYYTSTTSGNRVITGKVENNNVKAYDMNDGFVIGQDDGFVPLGIHEWYDYLPEEEELIDWGYDTDYMNCESVTFPSDFHESAVAGKTFTVGGDYDGQQIKEIIVMPQCGEMGATGNYEVAINTDGYGGAWFEW